MFKEFRRVLTKTKTTRDRLQQVFTAKMPAEKDEMSDDVRKQKTEDYNRRCEFDKRIEARINEGIGWNLRNYRIFAVMDLAWDADPINPWTFPLMLYAQGRIDLSRCQAMLQAGNCAEEFVEKDADGKEVGIRFPKYTDLKVNLVRSVITRRTAAQVVKFSNLYPHWKFEPRGNRPEDQLQAEVVSQLSDISSDNFGHKRQEEQAIRTMLLQPYSIDFVVDPWHKVQAWMPKPTSEEFKPTTAEEMELDAVTTEEGVLIEQPHPSRVFFDNSYALSTVNDDKGVRWLGFWTVVRAGEVAEQSQYWNREAISCGELHRSWLTDFRPFFDQYFPSTINFPPPLKDPPSVAGTVTDLAQANDRQAQADRYSQTNEDVSHVFTHYYEKVAPKSVGLGDYPFPLWLHLTVAGTNTVVDAEWLPCRPAAYAGFNQNDHRQINPSMGHEILAYQDHFTNLLSYLLLCIKTDNLKIIVLDLDQFRDVNGQIDEERLNIARNQLKGGADSGEPIVLELSRSKLAHLGMDPRVIIEMIQTNTRSAIDQIIRALQQLMQMVNVLLVISPQEAGQPAPSGISATESNFIASTTDSVYSNISEAVDKYRGARKRMWYECWVADGSDKFEVPVVNSYPDSVIQATGMTKVPSVDQKNQAHLVSGVKSNLSAAIIFTSRDGGERPSNAQNAANLNQLLANLAQYPGTLTKDKLYEIVNQIGRAAGTTLNLQRGPDEPNELTPDQNQEFQQAIENLTNLVEGQQANIQTIMQAIGPLLSRQPEPDSTAAPQTQP